MSTGQFISTSPKKKITIFCRRRNCVLGVVKKDQESIVAFRVTNVINDSVFYKDNCLTILGRLQY